MSNLSSQTIVRSLDHFIRGHGIRFIDLVLSREAIEPAAAAQAAASCTAGRPDMLQQACLECQNAFDDVDLFVSANLKWYFAVAEASGNPLFVAFLTSVYGALHAAANLEEFDGRTRKLVVGVHWQISDAIRLRDPAAARRRMARHLTAYSERLSAIDLSALPAAAEP